MPLDGNSRHRSYPLIPPMLMSMMNEVGKIDLAGADLLQRFLAAGGLADFVAHRLPELISVRRRLRVEELSSTRRMCIVRSGKFRGYFFLPNSEPNLSRKDAPPPVLRNSFSTFANVIGPLGTSLDSGVVIFGIGAVPVGGRVPLAAPGTAPVVGGAFGLMVGPANLEAHAQLQVPERHLVADLQDVLCHGIAVDLDARVRAEVPDQHRAALEDDAAVQRIDGGILDHDVGVRRTANHVAALGSRRRR